MRQKWHKKLINAFRNRKYHFAFPHEPPIEDQEVLSLDVGCGEDPHGIINCDITRPKNKIKNYVRCDAHSLPFRSSSFNEVYSNHVIEHLKNPHKMLLEVHRVIKHDGKLFLATPNKYSTDSYRTRRHRWHFTSSTIEKLCKKYFRKVDVKGEFAPVFPPFRFYLVLYQCIPRIYGLLQVLKDNPSLWRSFFVVATGRRKFLVSRKGEE